MTASRRIIFVSYDMAELLDLSGPAAVFSTATQLNPTAAYECIVASNSGGSILHSCGLGLETHRLSQIQFKPNDTVLVIGATRAPLLRAMADPELQNSLQRASSFCERYGSICTGSFLLASAGLINGKRVATHWAARSQLQYAFKQSIIEEDALYVNDGRLWTSAGVTTGIDMALAILEADHGTALRSKVAKQLVVYAHRPGSQSQFSEVLSAQTRVDEHYAGLVDWLVSRLDEPTKVEHMAAFAGMSVRNFHRRFKTQFGLPPGKFLEQLRLDRAKELIESGEAITMAGSRVGFHSPSSFRTSFKERFGVTPSHHRKMQGVKVP
uniref:GlxA family transcriptional regulator n=1 Tax=uncultured Altererythrobacter sp. TaxID=500840 RepID=UPI002633957B|nr:helix-turn-helix domain-containing protein [uncultured Altererythrobacter sp.]